MEVIRFASKVTLKTIIQDDNPSKIYTPILTLKFNEEKVENILNGSYNSNKIYFRVEFVMLPGKFWNALRILSAFILTIAIMVWIFRVINWHHRNKMFLRPSEFQPNRPNHYSVIIHIIAVGLHTLVVICLPPIVLTCLVWYVSIMLICSHNLSVLSLIHFYPLHPFPTYQVYIFHSARCCRINVTIIEIGVAFLHNFRYLHICVSA